MHMRFDIILVYPIGMLYVTRLLENHDAVNYKNLMQREKYYR